MTKTLPYVIVNICEYMIKDLNDKNSTIRYSEICEYMIKDLNEYMIKDLNDKNSTIRYSEHL